MWCLKFVYWAESLTSIPIPLSGNDGLFYLNAEGNLLEASSKSYLLELPDKPDARLDLE